MKIFSVFKLATVTILFSLFLSPLGAEILTNFEGGFEVDVPDTWLYRDMRRDGIGLNSGEVHMTLQPYSDSSLLEKIKILHSVTKDEGYKLRSEQSFSFFGVPAHEIIFRRKKRNYRIYYVLKDRDRGFLWTIDSQSTDSREFLEAQQIISSLRIKPL